MCASHSFTHALTFCTHTKCSHVSLSALQIRLLGEILFVFWPKRKKLETPGLDDIRVQTSSNFLWFFLPYRRLCRRHAKTHELLTESIVSVAKLNPQLFRASGIKLLSTQKTPHNSTHVLRFKTCSLISRERKNFKTWLFNFIAAFKLCTHWQILPLDFFHMYLIFFFPH